MISGGIFSANTFGALGGAGGGGGGGGGITIGGAITGGTANRVLYEDASNQLAESAGLQFNGTSLTIASLIGASSGNSFEFYHGANLGMVLGPAGSYGAGFTGMRFGTGTTSGFQFSSTGSGYNTPTVFTIGDLAPNADNTYYLGAYRQGGITPYPYLGAWLGAVQIGPTSSANATINYALDIRATAAATAVYSQFSIPTTTGVTSTDGTKVGLTSAGAFEVVNQEVGSSISLSIAGSNNTSTVQMDTATGDPSDGTVNYPRLRSTTQFMRIGANAKDFFRMNGGNTGTGNFGVSNLYADLTFPNATVIGGLNSGSDYQAGSANVGIFSGGLIAGQDGAGTNSYLSTDTKFSLRVPNPGTPPALYMDIDNQNVAATSFQIGMDANLDAFIKSRKASKKLSIESASSIDLSTASTVAWTIDSSQVLTNRRAANESTGAGAALLGANSPASTLSAPFTWITLKTSDGSTVYLPVWK